MFGAGAFRSLQSIARPLAVNVQKPARTVHEAGSAGYTVQEARALCRRYEGRKRDHPCDRDGGVNFLRSIEARRSCVTIPSRLSTDIAPVFSWKSWRIDTNFRGVCFSVAYTTPNGKSCRSFPKNRSIYHNSRCTYHVKRHQSLSGAKKRKKTRKHQAKTRKTRQNRFQGVV